MKKEEEKKKKKNQARYEILRPKPLTLTLFTWCTVCLVQLKGLNDFLSSKPIFCATEKQT